MVKSENIKANIEKIIKESIPKNVKITEEAITMLSNLCIDLLEKISIESGPDMNSSKNHLTREEILQIISKAGLNKYLIDLNEELKRSYLEEIQLNKISK